MAEQSDGEAAEGTLRLRLGRTDWVVLVLPILATRQWVAKLRAAVNTIVAKASETEDDEADPIGSLVDFSYLTEDAKVDLIVAYDRDNVLGGRQWLLEHALPTELTTAFEAIRAVSSPPDLAVLTMLDIFRTAAQAKALQLDHSSSTNGHSPTGTLLQDHSPKRSRTPSSIASGKLDRSA